MLDKVNNVDCMAMVDNVDYIYMFNGLLSNKLWISTYS